MTIMLLTMKIEEIIFPLSQKFKLKKKSLQQVILFPCNKVVLFQTENQGDKHVKQKASVSVSQVSKALAEVKRRHTEGQPAKIPDQLDRDVKKNFDLMGWLGGALSGGGIGLTALIGFGWEQILAITGSFILLFVLFLLLRKHIMKAISEARGDPA